MNDRRDSGVAMHDIRGDKSEQSLLGMIKQGLSSEPKTMPTLLLYDGAERRTTTRTELMCLQRKD